VSDLPFTGSGVAGLHALHHAGPLPLHGVCAGPRPVMPRSHHHSSARRSLLL